MYTSVRMTNETVGDIPVALDLRMRLRGTGGRGGERGHPEGQVHFSGQRSGATSLQSSSTDATATMTHLMMNNAAYVHNIGDGNSLSYHSTFGTPPSFSRIWSSSPQGPAGNEGQGETRCNGGSDLLRSLVKEASNRLHQNGPPPSIAASYPPGPSTMNLSAFAALLQCAGRKISYDQTRSNANVGSAVSHQESMPTSHKSQVFLAGGILPSSPLSGPTRVNDASSAFSSAFMMAMARNEKANGSIGPIIPDPSQSAGMDKLLAQHRSTPLSASSSSSFSTLSDQQHAQPLFSANLSAAQSNGCVLPPVRDMQSQAPPFLLPSTGSLHPSLLNNNLQMNNAFAHREGEGKTAQSTSSSTQKQQQAAKEASTNLSAEERLKKRRERARMYSHVARKRQGTYLKDLKKEVETLMMYRQMIEEAGDMIAVFSPDVESRFLFANEAFARVLQLIPTKLLGSSLWALMDETDKAKVMKVLGEIILSTKCSGQVTCRLQSLQPEGIVKNVEISMSMRYGRQGVICFIRLID